MVVGPFDTDHAVTLDELIAAREAGDAAGSTASSCRSPWRSPICPKSRWASNDAARIGRGQPVLLRGARAPLAAPAAYASHAGRAIALGEISEGQFHPTRVFRPG